MPITNSPNYLNKPRHEVMLEYFELMENSTRCNLIFLLLLYKSVSLAKFSKIMNMAKTTIAYHLNKCVKIGLIKEFEEESNRALKPKYYELDLDCLEYISTDSIDLRGNYTREGGQEFIWLIKTVKAMFNFYKNQMGQVEDYLEYTINSMDLDNSLSIQTVIEEYTNNNQCFSQPFTFTREALADFNIAKSKFVKEINKIVEQDRTERSDIPKEYLFYMHQIPLKKMIELKAFNSKSQKFGRKS